MEKGKITKEKFDRFLELEKEIQKMESKVSYKTYIHLQKQQEAIDEEVKSKEDELARLQVNTDKEKKDVELLERTIEGLVMGEDKKNLEREHAEYLEALAKSDSKKKLVDGLRHQFSNITDQIEKLGPEVKEFDKLRTELDDLLSDIFDGDYGSDLENKLESDYEVDHEKLERVAKAKYKWQNARNLLHYALKQMETGKDRWILLPEKPDQKEKYQICTEARNNFVAAIGNINNASKVYLENKIEFPYIKPQEVATLQNAVNNMYTDMIAPQRHQHAGHCYINTWKRLGALLQWFDKVIDGIIIPDYKMLKQKERETHNALKSERVRLMKEHLEKEGHKIDIDDSALSTDDSRGEDEQEDMMLSQPETTDQDAEYGQKKKVASSQIPLKDLAPPPSDEMIFGNLELIKQQHEKEKQDLEKTQAMNRARLQQGLEEKLAARRKKRNMQAD